MWFKLFEESEDGWRVLVERGAVRAFGPVVANGHAGVAQVDDRRVISGIVQV